MHLNINRTAFDVTRDVTWCQVRKLMNVNQPKSCNFLLNKFFVYLFEKEREKEREREEKKESLQIFQHTKRIMETILSYIISSQIKPLS